MITARDYSLRGDRDEIKGDAIVLFDGRGNPIVLVATVSPTLTHVFTVDKPAELRDALKQYGIRPSEQGPDLRT